MNSQFLLKRTSLLALGLLIFGSSFRAAQFSRSSVASAPEIEAQKSNTAKPASTAPAGTEAKRAKKQSSADRARLLLEEAYQLALNMKPTVKAEALTMIAETMKLVDKPQSVPFYRTAFEATEEIPLGEKQVNRAAMQSRLAIGLAEVDAEAAMELAARVEQPPVSEEPALMSIFSRGTVDFRAQAIQQVAMQMAEKDLDRAMILILPTLRDRDFPYEAVLPLAGRLIKEAPDKAERLLSELIQQFSAATPGLNQMLTFPLLIRAYANSDRNLVLQAIDVTLQKVPVMEENIKKEVEKSSGGKGMTMSPMPFSFGAMTKAMLLPTLRKVDPERATALEKEIQPTLEMLDKQSGGMFSSVLLNNDFDLTDRSDQAQSRMLDKIDPDKFPEEQRGAMGSRLALSLSGTHPEKAQSLMKYVTEDNQKALALASIAGAYASKDKEKARGVLSEAATLAEKVKDKADRAIVFASLGESAVRIDPAQSKSFYSTAFENFDQAMEELKRTTGNEKERTANQNRLQQLSRRYSRAIAGYAQVNFDDAVERARHIGEEQAMLQTLIRLATRVLAPDRPIPSLQLFNSGPVPEGLEPIEDKIE